MVNDGLESTQMRVTTLVGNVTGDSVSGTSTNTTTLTASNIQQGTASFVNGGSSVVTFSPNFGTIPNVVGTLVDCNLSTGSVGFSISGVSITGFVAFGYSTAGSKYSWQATNA